MFAGLPCVFIRLTGCNLRCTYCDTGYAYDAGFNMAISDILGQISSYSCSLVEITGGEPLLQNETPDLVEYLLAHRYTVLMETNGSLDISRVDRQCIKIVDVKCPASRMHHHNDPENLRRITPRDQLKLVMETREDYDFALNIIQQVPSGFPRSNILFSPVYGILSPETLAGWMLQDDSGARLHLQLHRIIWPEKERGI